MSRIVSGKVRLDVQPTDLADVVEAALDVVRPSADAKEIRLRKILDPRAGPVSGDPHRLQQVVWNLLSNAVKFTPKGGTIDVRARARATRISSHRRRQRQRHRSRSSCRTCSSASAQADSSTTRKHGGPRPRACRSSSNWSSCTAAACARKAPATDRGATFIVSLPLAAVRGRGVPEPARRSCHGARSRRTSARRREGAGGRRRCRRARADPPAARAAPRRGRHRGVGARGAAAAARECAGRASSATSACRRPTATSSSARCAACRPRRAATRRRSR